MKAKQAFGNLEGKEFVIIDSIGNLFAPPKGRNARCKSKWTTELNEATVYKTWQAAERAIKKHGLEHSGYMSLKEYKQAKF